MGTNQQNVSKGNMGHFQVWAYRNVTWGAQVQDLNSLSLCVITVRKKKKNIYIYIYAQFLEKLIKNNSPKTGNPAIKSKRHIYQQ